MLKTTDIFEVCVDSVESARAAQQGGAQRVELCANLVEGGTTPSLGMIREVRRQVTIGLMVMIRPRGGDFLYTAAELAVMRADIEAARSAGADGLVFGCLTADGRVDEARTAELLALAHPLPVTFHRAVDLCRDPLEAVETLAGLGAARVLTSGGRPTALEGAAVIAQMVAQAAGRMVVMAGGGITAETVQPVLKAAGVHEIHFSARDVVPSAMRHRVAGVAMGRAYQPDEYSLKQVSVERVRQVIAAAGRG